jgi:hypothetical protein
MYVEDEDFGISIKEDARSKHLKSIVWPNLVNGTKPGQAFVCCKFDVKLTWKVV